MHDVARETISDCDVKISTRDVTSETDRSILNINIYRQISNISRTKSDYLNVSRFILQLSLPNPLKPGVKVENEDVVGAAPTSDAPNTSEWSTISLPIEVRLVLDNLR